MLSRLIGAPFGMWWIHSLEVSLDRGSAEVWLAWGEMDITRIHAA